MHRDRGDPCAYHEIRLVVKNCSVEVEEQGVDSRLRRSRSDGNLRGATAGPLEHDGSAGRPAHTDDGHTGSVGHQPLEHNDSAGGLAHTVGGHSGSAAGSAADLQESPVSPQGSSCSWGELSCCSQYNLSGCSGHDSQDESCESTTSAPAYRSPWTGEECEAEWLRGKEEQHGAGTCKPCLYFKTRVGCTKGLQCSFCHLPHEELRQKAARPCRQARLQCKQLLAKLGGWREGESAAAVVRPVVRDLDQHALCMLSLCGARGPRRGGPGRGGSGSAGRGGSSTCSASSAGGFPQAAESPPQRPPPGECPP
ncbi:unnamed protein product [Prorocentrum cordatum]|uniref:C3H1-type domain-containing protein n=1 Tax=Prorocentrum cordatum TaxID=2364126 RepID=A0ABN9VXB2_9DINO|nr:unnamed protein product [Polarella glacialis]